jgi:hypothetical protein
MYKPTTSKGADIAHNRFRHGCPYRKSAIDELKAEGITSTILPITLFPVPQTQPFTTPGLRPA